MFSHITSQLLLGLVAVGFARAFDSRDTWTAIAPPSQVTLLYPNGTASLGQASIGFTLNQTEAGTLRVPVDMTILSPSGVSQRLNHTFDCVVPKVRGDTDPLPGSDSYLWQLGVALNETGTYTLMYNVTFGTAAGPPAGAGANSTWPCGTGAYAFQSFLVNATFSVDNTTGNSTLATHVVQLPAAPTGSGYIGQAPNGVQGGAQAFAGVSSVLALALAIALIAV